MSYRSSTEDDTYSSYSDDFDNENSPSPTKKNSKYVLGNKRKVPVHQSSFGSEDEDSSSTLRSSPIRKGTRKKPYKGTIATNKTKASSQPTSSKRRLSSFKGDSVQSRMLSAQRNQINSLSNQLSEAQIKLEELTKENRMLKTLQFRHEKSLKKFQDVEGDLPRLITQHMEDQRVLKARLRKSQEAERLTESKLKDSNDEIQRMESSLRRLKKIVYDKNLGERSELAKQLAAAEDKLSKEEKDNKELEKKLQLTTQSYHRQLRNEQARHRETREELEALKKKYNFTETRLKEKERALDVSNIYSHRVKAPTSERSFVTHRLSITARSDASPSKPLAINDSLKPIEDEHSFADRPSPHVLAATDDIKDYRKTIKSPLKTASAKAEKRDVTDHVGDDVTDRTRSKLNELHLHREVEDKILSSTMNEPAAQHELTRAHRPVFLTANESPSSTFVSERHSSPKLPAPIEKHMTPSPPPPKPEEHVTAPMKTEKELEEERRKLEEDRRRKADLLAKMKDLESTESKNTARLSDGDDILKFLSKDTKPLSRSFVKLDKIDRNPKVENLHKGVPSTTDISSRDTDEPELTFGGYAPSVAVPTKRKPQVKARPKPPSPTSSESDEPLLDLASGKPKKNDLLSQLFGDDSSQATSNGPMKNEKSVSSSRNSFGSKTTPRAKPIHSGYPWEKNVMGATQNHTGNGDARPSPKRNDTIQTTPAVKALPSFGDEDLEELTL